MVIVALAAIGAAFGVACVAPARVRSHGPADAPPSDTEPATEQAHSARSLEQGAAPSLSAEAPAPAKIAMRGQSSKQRDRADALEWPMPADAPGAVAGRVADVVDDAIRELKQGNLALSAPQSLEIDDSASVELVVSRSLAIAELEARLRDRTHREGATVKVSSRMHALLTGDDGLAITAQTESYQALSATGTTRWSWRVKATDEGKQHLQLVLYALITVHGAETSYEVQSFERDIAVEVSVGHRAAKFASANWQWLWSLILPVAAFTWKRRAARTAATHQPSTS